MKLCVLALNSILKLCTRGSGESCSDHFLLKLEIDFFSVIHCSVQENNQSLQSGHVGCFYILAVRNYAVLDIPVQSFV